MEIPSGTCFSDESVGNVRGITAIAIVGGQLRHLTIKIAIKAICGPIMSALCDAIALERTEFDFSGDRKELMTVNEQREWITVRHCNC